MKELKLYKLPMGAETFTMATEGNSLSLSP